MPLLETCQAIRADLKRRDEFLRQRAEAKVYIERAAQIAELRAGLIGTLGRVRVLTEHGFAVGVRNPGALLDRVQKYRENLSQGHGTTGPEHGHTKRALDAMQSALGAAADAALKAVISRIPTIEETFLKQVEANPLYAAKVAEIRAARDQLLRESKRDLDAVALQSFLKQHKVLLEMANGLNPADFPKEVLEFFKAAREKGAPLVRFTEGVRQWFEERGQLKNIRITVVDE